MQRFLSAKAREAAPCDTTALIASVFQPHDLPSPALAPPCFSSYDVLRRRYFRFATFRFLREDFRPLKGIDKLLQDLSRHSESGGRPGSSHSLDILQKDLLAIRFE